MKRFGMFTSLMLVAALTFLVIPASAQNMPSTNSAAVTASGSDSNTSTAPSSANSTINVSLTPTPSPAPSRAASVDSDSILKRFEVFAGYSFLSNEIAVVDDGDFEQLLHGYAASVTFNFNKNFGFLADFSGHNGSMTRNGTHQTEDQYYFLFGPQVSHSFGKARISGHVTVGVAQQHYGENFSGESHFNVKEANFAVGAGGAFDWMFTDRFGWRVLQVDYLMSDFTFERVHNVRGSTGLIVRF